MIRCDDGSTPAASGLELFSKYSQEASTIMGAPLDACTRYKDYMIEAGFENVTEVKIKLPSAPWPRDKRLKLIGAFEMHGLLRGLSGMSLRMFSRAFGWSVQEIESFLTKVRTDTQNLHFHTYWDL